MIAVDTNLLVRLATNDVPAERDAVATLLGTQEALILKTVLLETEWVLRSRYGYSAAQSMAFFQYLLALPSMTFEDAEAVRAAIGMTGAGIDFADAMHLASAGSVPLATLDRKLQRRAVKIKGVKVQLVRVRH